MQTLRLVVVPEQSLSVGEPGLSINFQDICTHYEMANKSAPIQVSKRKRLIQMYFRDWLDRPVDSITESEIRERFDHVRNSLDAARAGQLKKWIVALLQFAADEYHLKTFDPREIYSIKAAEPSSGIVTLRSTWAEYRRKRKLAPGTIISYNKALSETGYLRSWLDIPIESITKEMVLAKQSELLELYSEATANQVLRVARAMITFAIFRFDLKLPYNPVLILSHLRAWLPDNKRTTYVPEEKMRDWYLAVQEEPRDITRDYLCMLMLTGLRRNECASLEWKNIDLERGFFQIAHTKNGDRLVLPLANYTLEMLKARRERYPKDQFVFATIDGGAPFELQYCSTKRIERRIGTPFSPHVCRRTYLTVGDSLDIPLDILKQLANHRQSRDITLRYIQRTADRLREPCERIANRIVELWQAPGQPLSQPIPRTKKSIADSLSEDDIEVLKLLATGLTNKQIAEQLSIGFRTIEVHVYSIRNKILGSSAPMAWSRAKIATEALRLGLIDIQDIKPVSIGAYADEELQRLRRQIAK